MIATSFEFEKCYAASLAGEPKRVLFEKLKPAIQVVQSVGKGPICVVYCESDKSDGAFLGVGGYVGGDCPSTVLGTGQAKAVVAGRGGYSEIVGVLFVLEKETIGAAKSESFTPGWWEREA